MTHTISITKGTNTKTGMRLRVNITENTKLFTALQKYMGFKNRIAYSTNHLNWNSPKELRFNLDPGRHPSVAGISKLGDYTGISFGSLIKPNKEIEKLLPIRIDENKAYIKDNILYVPLINRADSETNASNVSKEESLIKTMPDVIVSKLVNDDVFITKLANTVVYKLQPSLNVLQQQHNDSLKKVVQQLINYWEEPESEMTNK